MDQKSIGDDSRFLEPQLTDIRSCWPKIKKGIEAILEENPILTFIPEVDTITKEKTLLIWIAYTYEQGKGNWIDHVEWFNTLALNSNCKFIEARSRVPEMREYAVANGWEIDTIVYRRHVNE